MTVKTEHSGAALVVTLNRPERYNATDSATIDALSALLDESLANTEVERILITSDHPKAFCAGGDLRAVYELIARKEYAAAKAFFAKEYALIGKMATYAKPIISLVDGLCFGGGMGLSAHNRYRVVTENAKLAMPETAIGFFPDVGMSHKFAKMSEGWRNFYGLTGYPIPLGFALKNDLADFFVEAGSLPSLRKALSETAKGEEKITLLKFAKSAPREPEPETWIEEIFSNELEVIFARLERSPRLKAKEILGDLRNKSPLSLRLTRELFKLGQNFSLEESLKTDLAIAEKFLYLDDFIDGIRAKLIDKNQPPNRVYRSIADVPRELIAAILSH